MLENDFDISIFNEHSILIQFDIDIDEKSVDLLLFYKNIILQKSIQPILQIINTYNSLLVVYDLTINKIYSCKKHLFKLIISHQYETNSYGKIYEIPVCYDKEFGLDLQYISEQNDIEIDQISELHSSLQYRVFFIGFLPGFPYLSYVDDRLQINRKKKPRASTPKGSVGIANLQTGIYPKSSPGGWQIIGKTPVELFNSETRNSFLKAGDYIQFVPVCKDEFLAIEDQVFHQEYHIKKL